jgi:large subunit ribosomal protein L4
MAILDVINIKGEKVSEIELDEQLFCVPVKKEILHEVVVMQLANKRAGTACVKNRSDVSGSGRKLYRQKGTGNARAGDVKSPLRVGGGVIFGPKPRSYSYKVPKKVRRKALQMAISDKIQDKRLIILDNFDLPDIKTKRFVEVMRKLDVKKGLIVTDKPMQELELSSRNVSGIKLMRSEGLNVYDILNHRHLIMLQPSIDQIRKRLIGMQEIKSESGIEKQEAINE